MEILFDFCKARARELGFVFGLVHIQSSDLFCPNSSYMKVTSGEKGIFGLVLNIVSMLSVKKQTNANLIKKDFLAICRSQTTQNKRQKHNQVQPKFAAKRFVDFKTEY